MITSRLFNARGCFSRFGKNNHRKWKPNGKNLLKDFSIMNVGSRDVLMLLYYLYKEYGMYHITYEFSCNRCYLYYISDNVPSYIRSFFDDRSSCDVEFLAIDCGEKYPVGTVTTVPMVEYADGFMSPEVFKWTEKKKELTADEKRDKITLLLCDIYNILDPSGESSKDLLRYAYTLSIDEFFDWFTEHFVIH